MARSTLLLVAAAATSVVAQQWGAITTTADKCKPTVDAFECDDDKGGVYTTTLTVYPKGCPLYTPYDSWPIKTGDNTWDPVTKTTKPWDPKKTSTWETYVDPAPKPTWDPSWDPTWKGKGKGKDVVTVTLTEVYTVPCETGWATSTSTIYTTWCGCQETPKPVKPEYTTYTTTCPESWGVGPTVTVVVPYAQWTPEVTVTVPQTWSTASVPVNAASTWVTASVPVNAASTWVTASVPAAYTACPYSYTTVTSSTCSWADWDTSKTASSACATSTTVSTITPTTCTGTWATWAATPVNAASCSYSTTTITTSSCGWAAWDTSKTASSTCATSTVVSTVTPASCTATWAAVSGTGAWSPVSAYTGAASSTASSKVFVVLGAAIAGVAYLL